LRKKIFSIKKAKIQALFWTLLIIVAGAALPAIVWGQTATLWVDPQSITNTALIPGSSFAIDINITDVNNLYGFEFKLGYQTSVLTATNIAMGSFFWPNSTQWINQINDVEGYAWYSLTLPAGTPPEKALDGNGTLATIEFVVDDFGVSILDLYDVLMGDGYANPIVPDIMDGYFANSPVASFTYSPLEPVENEVITFNASESASMQQGGSITEYSWNFGDGNVTTVATPIITHAYTLFGDYTVNLTVTDNLGLTAWVTQIVPVLRPGVHVFPSSGPVGTKVLVRGFGFDPYLYGALFFDDMNINYELSTDATGRFNATFNVPLSEPGSHLVKAYFYALGVYNTTAFTVIDVWPLEINVDVGTVHFRGEIAQFFIQTVFKGTPVDVITKTAKLYKPVGPSETLTITQVATGLYKVSYIIPVDAPIGSYALVVEARYLAEVVDSRGASMKSFQLSSTLDGWNAWLVEMQGDIGKIKTDIGLINLNMSSINATMVNVEGNIATIETDVGTILDILEEWTGTVSSITTPQGTTYRLLILTTSVVIPDEVTVSDYTVSIPVSGADGTFGTVNILIPKQLLPDIKSSIDKVKITLDDAEVNFTLEEQTKVYLLSVSYTHSAHTIKVFLTGIPPSFPWIWIALGILAVVAAAAIVFVFWRRKQKAKVAVEVPPTTVSSP